MAPMHIEIERPADKHFRKNGNLPSALKGMTRALTAIGHQYDAILANQSLTAWPVSISRTGTARKFYYVQAYEPEYYRLDRTLKTSILQMLSWGSYYLPLTQVANAPIYLNYPPIRAEQWVPPGIDLNNFHRRSSQPLKDKLEVTLGVIGRNEPTKGVYYVLKAFEKLSIKLPALKLHIAYGNVPSVWHHPKAIVVVPNGDEQLADYYRNVDILIAPGIVQLGACHYPVLEAMACGTPVITTGYIPADEDNSILVPIKDADAICSAIEQWISMSKEKVLDKTNRAYAAVQKFTWLLRAVI